MTDWSLELLLSELHEDIRRKLQTSRTAMGHPVAKGDSSEGVWLEMLKTYMPRRYEAARAYVVDSKGAFSQQMDVVIFDRQYSPFIFTFQGQTVIPAESVYAVFESKQALNADQVKYAMEKVASVRTLHRTSLPIPHAGGRYEPKKLQPILGGLLTFDSDWTPPLGSALVVALNRDVTEQNRLDMGCIAEHGTFIFRPGKAEYEFAPGGKAATAFLFDLISTLQAHATVPMIDIGAYRSWLIKS